MKKINNNWNIYYLASIEKPFGKILLISKDISQGVTLSF